jgi:MFS family permease
MLCYIWHSRRRKYPIVKTELLRIRSFRISVFGNLFSRIGFGGVPFVVPLLLQIGLHYPAQIAGLLLAPIALGIMSVRPFTVKILRQFGYKKLLIGNTLLLGVFISAFYFVNQSTAWYVIGVMTWLFGIGISLQYSGMNSLGYSEVEKADLSAATSIISTLQQLAQSFGVAIAAIFIEYFAAGGADSSLTVSVFHHTFLVMGGITWLSAILFLGLHKDDGGKMIEA